MTDPASMDKLRTQLAVLAEVARLAADTLDVLIPNPLVHVRCSAERDASDALDRLREAIEQAEKEMEP